MANIRQRTPSLLGHAEVAGSRSREYLRNEGERRNLVKRLFSHGDKNAMNPFRVSWRRLFRHNIGSVAKRWSGQRPARLQPVRKLGARWLRVRRWPNQVTFRRNENSSFILRRNAFLLSRCDRFTHIAPMNESVANRARASLFRC